MIKSNEQISLCLILWFQYSGTSSKTISRIVAVYSLHATIIGMSIQNSADRWIFACDLNQLEPVYAFGMTLRPSSAERVEHWVGLAATLVEVTRTLVTLDGLYVYLQKYYVETPKNMYNLWFSCMPFHIPTWELLAHEIVTYSMWRG